MSHTKVPCDPLTIFPNHSPPELLSITFLKSYNVQIPPIIHLAPVSAAARFVHHKSTLRRHSVIRRHSWCLAINDRRPSKCRKLRYELQIPPDSRHTSFWCPLHLHDSVSASSMLMVSLSTQMYELPPCTSTLLVFKSLSDERTLPHHRVIVVEELCYYGQIFRIFCIDI